MRLTVLAPALLLALAAHPASAEVAPSAAAEAAGVSVDRLPDLTRGLRDSVGASDIAGAAAMAARGRKVFYSAAAGSRDLAAGEPMALDTLFRIYSMTRPITSVAI